MNLLDFIILLPIGYYAYRGFQSGFIKVFFSIAGLIIAIFATFKYMGPIAGYVAPFAENQDTAIMITGVVIFLAILVIMQAAGFWLEQIFDLVRIGFVNQIAGLLFGILKSALLISAILLLMAGFGYPDDDYKTGSSFYPLIIQIAPAAYNLAAGLYPDTADFIDTIEQSIKGNNTLKKLPIFEPFDLDS